MPRSEVHHWSATSDQVEKNRSVKKILCCECKKEQPFKKSSIADEKGKERMRVREFPGQIPGLEAKRDV